MGLSATANASPEKLGGNADFDGVALIDSFAEMYKEGDRRGFCDGSLALAKGAECIAGYAERIEDRAWGFRDRI
jgi:hypothetical protein